MTLLDPIILDLHADCVVLDVRAMDGTWCRRPYKGNSHGCKNYGGKEGCPPDVLPFWDLVLPRGLKLIIQPFDLDAHADRMKKRPRKDKKKWTEAQARCLLYWQPRVHKTLNAISELEAMRIRGGVVLRVPEANGLNVFATCAKCGVVLDTRNPSIIRKVMVVGVGTGKGSVVRQTTLF